MGVHLQLCALVIRLLKCTGVLVSLLLVLSLGPRPLHELVDDSSWIARLSKRLAIDDDLVIEVARGQHLETLLVASLEPLDGCPW